MPKLKVKKDWATGLDPNFVDNYVLTSMFDHRNFNEYNFELRGGSQSEEKDAEESKTKEKTPGKAKLDELSLFATESYPELSKKGRRLQAAEGDTAATGDAANDIHGDDVHSFDGHFHTRFEDQGAAPDFGDGKMQPHHSLSCSLAHTCPCRWYILSRSYRRLRCSS